LILAPRREHSRKPDEMRQMIEKVSYEPRIELFARERFPEWDAWGNEV
jgi:N6-adenosine-specific RNA methylase IME4